MYLIETCLSTSWNRHSTPRFVPLKQQGSAEFYSADILATTDGSTIGHLLGQALNPARPGQEKSGRHSLITGLAGLRLEAKAQKPKIRPDPARNRTVRRQSGTFEVTTGDVVT